MPKFAVIAYGKLGGKELGYVSDLDVIFLFDDDDQEAPFNYAKLAQRFITWMTAHTPAGILFDIDTALRPDGASGMLVSSVAAFERYQQQFGLGLGAPGADARALLRRRRRHRHALRSDPRQRAAARTAAAKLDELKDEVLKMRKRMRDANPNRTALFDLKHDAGGMIDIEFIVQYLVLRYSARASGADRSTPATSRCCGCAASWG